MLFTIFLLFLSFSCIFIHFVVNIYFYDNLIFLTFNYKKSPKRIKTLQLLSPEEAITLKALKILWSLEIEKSILEDLFITNSHHWVLCRIHTQFIPKLGVHTTIQALSLSSLLIPKPLGVPISLNIQPKSLSLTRI